MIGSSASNMPAASINQLCQSYRLGHLICFDKDNKDELSWWKLNATLLSASLMSQKEVDQVLESDASKLG